MAIRIIGEIGSCHNGKFSYGKEAIGFCSEAGLDAIKFQLFPKTAYFLDKGNVWLDPQLIWIAQYALESGLDLPPCFDEAFFPLLLNTQPSFIKFAFEKRSSRWDLRNFRSWNRGYSSVML